MASNCSAPLSFIHRAAVRRIRQIISRGSHVHVQQRAPSYYFAASPVTTSIDPPRGIIDIDNKILQRPCFYPNHATNSAIGRVRTMVMITQTKSSEKDLENNSNTNPAATPNNNDIIEEATNAKGELVITASCASRIKQLATTRPNPDSVYLRLYVDAGGCSGFQYKFLLLSEDNDGNNSIGEDGEEEDGTIDLEEDIIFVKDGMRVVIDQTSLDLLEGSTIDYVQEMIRSSFAVVGNPQSESACGCGSSFAVKNFESNPALD